ncbi:MAG TPA: alpha/beta hydrolase-fold protein [Streptosporangiaceae bacterium]|nr:alpha/beta hydrolase-fold protein [Streptosporangiaceae bacterium]
MLEPQSTLLFLLLLVVFVGLVAWMALARQPVFRVLAACLAFIPAMLFGVAAVNKYYDYYQTWGAAISDLTGGGAGNAPKFTAGGVNGKQNIEKDISQNTNQVVDSQVGLEYPIRITGTQSHLTRDVYIYLPPQYFQAAYANYHFPVVELLHGSPGSPTAWVDVLNVIPTFLHLMAIGQAQPAVLVMPDTDGGLRYSLQCLNYPGGIQDMSFVARDVPAAVSKLFRVQPPGKAWGVAGYSEGGYCAANIALNVPDGYGYAGVLSGYFIPGPSQLPIDGKPNGKPVKERPFTKFPGLMIQNSPLLYVTKIPTNVLLPQFWLAAGQNDHGDVATAASFRQLLGLRQANVTLFTPPGGHTGSVWRASLSPMLTWMTPQLAEQAQLADQIAAHKHPLPAGSQPGAKPAGRPGKQATAKATPHPAQHRK